MSVALTPNIPKSYFEKNLSGSTAYDIPALPRVQLAYDFANGSGDQETASRLDELACQVTALGKGEVSPSPAAGRGEQDPPGGAGGQGRTGGGRRCQARPGDYRQAVHAARGAGNAANVHIVIVDGAPRNGSVPRPSGWRTLC